MIVLLYMDVLDVLTGDSSSDNRDLAINCDSHSHRTAAAPSSALPEPAGARAPAMNSLLPPLLFDTSFYPIQTWNGTVLLHAHVRAVTAGPPVTRVGVYSWPTLVLHIRHGTGMAEPVCVPSSDCPNAFLPQPLSRRHPAKGSM